MVWKIYAPRFQRSLSLVHEHTFKNNVHKSTAYLRARKDNQLHTLAAPIKTTHDNNNGLSS